MGTVIQDYVNKGYENHSGFQIKYLDEQPIESLYKYSEYCLIRRWLRNKHNVDIAIITNYRNRETKSYRAGLIYVKNNEVDSFFIRPENDNIRFIEYYSYELSLEAALEIALTLI